MNWFNKGQFARRAMELGGFPVRISDDVPRDCVIMVAPERDIPAPPALWLSKTRLIQAMRKIDPDLAHMIESLAPVYLVKR